MAQFKASDLEKYYENEFFKISHPSSPLVSIQFRTKIVQGNITDSSQWQEITLNPSNFFDNLEITDNGGLQKIELNLFDKNMANIENIITKAIVVSRTSNKFAGEKEVSVNDGLFVVKVDTTSSANMRVRFGYSEPDSDWINETSFNGEYAQRTKTRTTVGLSPWIYFQIIGAKFKVTEIGIRASISAFSVTGNFIDRMKILKRFAIIRAEPEDILNAMNDLFQKASNNTVSVEVKNAPLIPTNEDGTKYIEINLGTKASEEGKYYMSIRNFLDSFKDKIPPKKYNIEGVVLNETDDQEAEGEDMAQELGYDYMVINEKTQEGKIFTKIIFYYPEPEKQELVRTYIWKEYSTSIIKSLDIESKLDFASLNREIFVYDRNENSSQVFLARPESTPGNDENGDAKREESQNNYLGSVKDVTNAINSDDFNITFVSDIVNTSSGSTHASEIQARVAHQIVKYINEGVYQGTMTIPLDPFYLFDNELRRYQYVIRLVVRRPNYYENGKLIEGGLSYLSGYYLVSDITHSISSSGGETRIGLMRWSVGI
jgi:hypothetical protein